MEGDWRRLASYVVSARTERDWSQEHLAEVAGIKPPTLSAVETGKRVRLTTLTRVERALGWKPGSAEQILHGGEPESDLVPEREIVPGTHEDDERARELTRRRAELAAARDALNMMIAELDGELETRNARRTV